MWSRQLSLLFTGCLLAALAQAQSVDRAIEKYVTYIGGAKRWHAVKTMVTGGSYNYGGMVFPFSTFAKAPNRYRFIVPFQGKYFEQAFDGKAGWKIDAFKGETKKTRLSGKAATALMNEADIELESPLIDYKSKGHSATLQGTDTVGSAPCYRVQLARSSGDTETYLIDTTSGKLLKKLALSKNSEMENAVMEMYYSDYRPVGGITIPFKSVGRVQGQTVLTITVSKVAVNTAVSDVMFKP